MSRPTLSLSFVALFMSMVICPNTSAEELYIASWNVENLFDLQRDLSVELKDDFTPDSPKKWTKERLGIKLTNLSEAISKMNAGKGPDVLGLCEVENRKVVEMLRDKLAPLGRKYEIVHKESPSDRGIDTALLYDANVFSLADSKFHFVDADKTRDIVEAKLHRDGSDLFVFVNHWPSRRNPESQRLKAAEVLRKRIDAILAADPKADIVMVGDFNDEPDNISLRDHLRATPSKDKLVDGALFNSTASLAADKKGTFFYENEWELIDHIIVSPGLLDEVGFQLKDGSTERIVRPELMYQPPYPKALARPSTSYSKNSFHKNGYSDHIALGCVIVE
jgi:endonuclease/exonuclease/phosphatase family metal-dependent hydrolase